MTFFGGETLMNFPILKVAIPYARQRAAELGKQVEFSLTTNATLLQPETIEFLADNDIGVTVSIDGPRTCRTAFVSSTMGVEATTSSCQRSRPYWRATKAALSAPG